MVSACHGPFVFFVEPFHDVEIQFFFKLDEDENGGLRGLAEVLMSYGEHHFDGSPNQKGSRRGVWAGVLLMCGQFERVTFFRICYMCKSLTNLKAVAALWEHQETEIEAAHLAIALAYHGLLRVPSRAETSDMTPCEFATIDVLFQTDVGS